METLRRLKMVKIYRSYNDLTQLRMLIEMRSGCVYELQTDVCMKHQFVRDY